jgi:tryptophan synthase alpha chain
MSKLSTTLKDIVSRNRKALVAYIVAGDPAPGVTVPLMHRIVAAGVDVIELGVPFSDPEAEGPVIQKAHERALKHNVSLKHCLKMVAEFRQQDQETPVVLMGYLNPIETMGYEAFSQQAKVAGVSGTIIVNLPPEEAGDLTGLLERNEVEPVYLLAPTTTDERAATICAASRGFVYYVSLKGTTGAATLDIADVKSKMARFRGLSSLPILVGFGVKDGQSAKAVTELADGAVVGTAIVKLMEENQSDPALLEREVIGLIKELRAAID